MKEFWNDRYSKIEFAYGKEPNVFFKNEFNKLENGKVLLPGDGEGRNSVYAATRGWSSYACDLSEEGKAKAEKLALENKVEIDYKVGDFGSLEYLKNFFDVVVLVYAHFPVEKKMLYHRLVNKYLKVGGTIIFEAFGKNHLHYNSKNPNVGGPKDIDMLYSQKEIKDYFPNYKIVKLEEVETDLQEGQFHFGKGSVIRFVGKKLR